MINLRAWTADDTETMLQWFIDDPDMIEQVGQDSVVDIVKAVTMIMQSPNSAIMAAENGTGELLGYVSATNAQVDGSANVHIGVAPHRRGKGIALMRRGLEYAFEELGLETLIAAVPEGRPEIEKFDKHFGFREPDAKILMLTRGEWEKRNGR